MPSPREQLYPGRQFIDTALDALDSKTRMSRELTVPYLQRAAMAGIIIGVFYGAYYAVVATFAAIPAGDSTLIGVGRFLGALVFGWALVFIYYSKSELLTSNMMVATIGLYYRRTTPRRVLGLLTLCYLGNALGGLLLATIVRFSTLASGTVLEQMAHSVATKVGYIEAGLPGMADLLMRAILCNLMINIAVLLVYNGAIKSDVTKTLAMVMAVFIFAFLGLEHSVANTVLFWVVGLSAGVDPLLAAANVAIALLGNYIGGGLLIGAYYAYANDENRGVR
ncbi:MAG: formate/nitrite transporter family protein [Propionicimonas sp.]